MKRSWYFGSRQPFMGKAARTKTGQGTANFTRNVVNLL